MRKHLQKKIDGWIRRDQINNWLSIAFFIGALIYFNWLLSGLQTESEKLKERRDNLRVEFERQKEDTEHLQAQFQIQFKEAAEKFKNILWGGEMPEENISSNQFNYEK